MAKTAKVKKRDVSLHSRASRRQGTSPPPPSLAVKARAEDTNTEQPWLYHAQNAGVSKKSKTKQLTRQQRLRQQKGLEHGERNTDKLQKKVLDSKRRARKVYDRRSEWEELNGAPAAKTNETPAETAQEAKSLPAKSWTEKMVDVELKEAMEEIEGFELPSLGGPPEDEKMEAEDAGKDDEALPAPARAVKEADEEGIDHVT